MLDHPPFDRRGVPLGPGPHRLDPTIDGVILLKCTKSVLLGADAKGVEERYQFKREMAHYFAQVFDPHPAFAGRNLLTVNDPVPPRFNSEGDIEDFEAMRYMRAVFQGVQVDALQNRWSAGPILIDDHTCCETPDGHVKSLKFQMGLFRRGVPDMIPWTLNDIVTRHVARGWTIPSHEAEFQLRTNPILMGLSWRVR